MNGERTDITPARSSFFSRMRGWLEQGKNLLVACRPPVTNWHFLMIQGIVVFIATGHVIHETGPGPYFAELYFMPTGLFLVPVVYAALVFGLAGALATALWAVLLSTPVVLLLHSGSGKLGETFQLTIVIVVALLAGRQVDSEKNARRQTETAMAALQTSRARYRSLFESSHIAILILDSDGVICETNPAASVLFGRAGTVLKGMSMIDVLWTLGQPTALGSSQHGDRREAILAIKPRDGPELYLQQTVTHASDDKGNLITQALFSDISKEYSRQASLKAFTARVISAQEEERLRIARELHDEILQSLILLYRRLDYAGSTSEPVASSLLNALRQARGMATEIIEELRDFTKTLRPPILDHLGVVTSIRRLLEDMSERTEIECKLRVIGETQRLPSETELGMFRIAQEALRNIERHAKATRASVTITFTPPVARLEVIDNGAGFPVPVDPADLVDSKRLGITSMRERAHLLGGKLEIRSKPGKGTRISLSLPMVSGLAEVSNAVK